MVSSSTNKLHTLHALFLLVTLASSWPENTFVPQNSAIHMTCTQSGERNQVPYWEIRLPSTSGDSQFDDSGLLNEHGLYKCQPQVDLETTNSTIIGLLINRTEGNNGTRISCVYLDDFSGPATISETTLIILGKIFSTHAPSLI